jgi:hypothetical protein
MASSSPHILDQIGPWSRLCALGLLIVSFTFSTNPVPITISATILLGAGFLLNCKQTLHLFLSVIVPFAVFTLVAASIAVPTKATINLHSQNLSSDISWAAYAFRFIKISGVCFSVSLLVGSLAPSGLYRWLVGLKLPKHTAFQIASPLVIVHSLAHQLRTIFDARLAQGYVGTRGFFSMGKQLIPVLTILISSGLTTAIERGDTWKQDDVMSLLAKDNTHIQSSANSRWFVSVAILITAGILSLANVFWNHFR